MYIAFTPLDHRLIPATLAPTPNTGYLIINMFYSNATNSLAAANFMTSIIIINYTAACIAGLAAASRQLWAFARNHGLPFSSFFAPVCVPLFNLLPSFSASCIGYGLLYKIILAHDIPLNSVLFSSTIPVIIALLNIGSTLALQILLSIINSALIASYTITIGCILMHRLRGGKLPHARFSLGKYGALINILALIYILPIFVFSFFPAAPKPDSFNMNWAILLLGGPIILATIYYFLGGRKIYTPPDQTIDDYIVRYKATTESSEKEMSSGVTKEKAADDYLCSILV